MAGFQSRTTMKIIVLAFIALACMLSVADGFRIADCRTPGDHNLNNGDCHSWTTRYFTYQSDKGCTLTFYEQNCSGNTGRVWSTTKQNQCSNAGFTPKHIKCA